MNAEAQPVESEVTEETLDAIANGEEVEIPEQAEEKEPEQEEQKQEKLVPLAALHEARATNREMRQKMQQMEQRFAQITEYLGPKQELPSVEEDPVANFNARIAQFEQQFEEQRLATEHERYVNNVVTNYRSAAEQFKAQAPDFQDAYNYLVQGRLQQYIDNGYSPQEADYIVKQEELNVVQNALQMGANPAAFVYNLALSNGYTKKEAKQAAEQATLENVAKGQKVSKSLSGANGKGQQNLTLEALANMDDADFNKYWNEVISKS